MVCNFAFYRISIWLQQYIISISYRNAYQTYFNVTGKNGTTELCPVKKLAIIRAVEWMQKNINNSVRVMEWDNDDVDCNLFPSKETKERIETKVKNYF